MSEWRCWLWVVGCSIIGLGGIGCGPNLHERGDEPEVEWLRKEIEGCVSEAEEGVVGMEVRIVQGERTLASVRTTSKGNFRFDRVPKGVFDLVVVETTKWEGAQEPIPEDAFRYSDRLWKEIEISRRKTRLVGYVFRKKEGKQEPFEGVEVRALPDSDLGKLIGTTDETGRYVIVLGDEFSDKYMISAVAGDSVATSTTTLAEDIQKLSNNPVSPIIITDEQLVEDIEGYISEKAYKTGSGKTTKGE